MTDTPTTSTPEGGEPQHEKPKSWIKRHPVWASFIAASIVVIGASAAAGGADQGDTNSDSNNKVAETTTTLDETESNPVDDTTTTTEAVPEPTEVNTGTIEAWVMSGDGLDVAEWMGNIGGDAATMGAATSDIELQGLCQDAYLTYFSGDILPKMQSAPGELGVLLEDSYFAYEQGFRLCAEGDMVGALPAVIKGTEHLTAATEVLSQYVPS